MSLFAEPRGSALAPVEPGERIAVLDILRGFALLGICVINLPGFYSAYYCYMAGQDPYPAWYDRGAQFLIDFLGSGKFNSIFSFLFGLGFAIQLDRAAARGISFAATYLRRLLTLFLFGAAHALLVWNGDVLHIYAILGVPLLLLRKLPDKWLWVIVALLVLAPGVRTAVAAVRAEKDPRDKMYWLERAENQLRVYGSGPYWGTVQERFRETREGYLENGDAWFWAIMATTLTIGFIVGRRRIFQNLPQYLPQIRRLAWWSGGLGFTLAAAFATCSMLAEQGSQEVTLLGFLEGALYILNRPILCTFYIVVIILLAQVPRFRAWMDPLASVGRMPLTNYLMQSVIASTIFYGYGLGYYHKIGPAVGVLIAVAIYACQVIYSNFWMARFRFGPMEWLWRFLTYGKAPQMVAHHAQAVTTSA